MMKKVLLVMMAVMLIAAAGCGRKSKSDAAMPNTEALADTQEVTVPGLEDSIFDENYVPETTKPVPTETTLPGEEEPLPAPGEMDFETFRNMKPARQREYQESFESIEAFYDWYAAAQEAYEKEHVPIYVGDGVIDMSKIVGN